MLFRSESARHPAGLVGILDAELVQTEDEQGRDDEGLQAGEEVNGGATPSRVVGSRNAQAAQEEVVGGEGETEGQAARSAADIEGEGDGEDNGEEEQRAPKEAEDHASAGCGGVYLRASQVVVGGGVGIGRVAGGWWWRV